VSQKVLDALDDMLGPHIYPARHRWRRRQAVPDLPAPGKLNLKAGKFRRLPSAARNYPGMPL